MKSLHRTLLFALLLGLLASTACRLSAAPTPTEHPGWTTYPALTSVAGAVFDQDGNLWLAGNGGVVKWNPTNLHFVTFDLEDGLPDTYVNCIAVSSDNTVWIGTNRGVSQFDGRSWKTFTSPEGLASGVIYALAAGPEADIWLGGPLGASHYDGQGWTDYARRTPHDVQDITSIAVGPGGKTWFVGSPDPGQTVLLLFEGQEWTTHGKGKGWLRGSGDFPLAVTPDGLVWVGTSHGLTRFDGADWEDLPVDDESGNVSALVVAQDGSLWGDGPSGVFHFDGETWTSFADDAMLPASGVEAIAAAPDGTTWVAHSEGSISRYDGQAWTAYRSAKKDILPVVASDGTLWAANYCPFHGGVAHFDGEAWTCYTSFEGLPDDDVWAIAAGREDGLWIGTKEGLSYFDGHEWSFFSPPEHILAPFLQPDCRSVGSISVAGDGTILAALYCYALVITPIIIPLPTGTFGGGILRFDGEIWTSYTQDDGLADNEVLSILEDSSGATWFGTINGVSKFDSLEWTTYTTTDGLAGNEVRAIADTSNGDLWLGTDGGISRFDGEGWTTYGMEEGMPSDMVFAVAADVEGRIWAGTSSGVSKFDGENWITFTAADGLLPGRVSAIAAAPDGSMWFATLSGLSHYAMGDE